MDTSDETLETAAAANELYWGSDKSVNQIAEELDLSKGAFYGLIEPLRTGLGCPRCGGEAVHTNRTSRDKKIVSCSLVSCNWQGSLVESVSLGGEGAVTLPSYEEADEVPPLPASARAIWNRTIAGGALLGAAAGLALVIWARRK